ncbi:hypothetical protein GH721_12620 [Kriegella sp. EG-1]|nr:hypothetical protein [Flavobacteriaceae bacterium EG-1]
MLNSNRKIFVYILIVFLILIAILLYLNAEAKGFPDGHLTELDKAEKPLYYFTSILSFTVGLFFFYLTKFKSNTYVKRFFFPTLVFLVIVFLLIGCLDWYFITILDNGSGG